MYINGLFRMSSPEKNHKKFSDFLETENKNQVKDESHHSQH